jgi:hypothetical protein
MSSFIHSHVFLSRFFVHDAKSFWTGQSYSCITVSREWTPRPEATYLHLYHEYLFYIAVYTYWKGSFDPALVCHSLFFLGVCACQCSNVHTRISVKENGPKMKIQTQWYILEHARKTCKHSHIRTYFQSHTRAVLAHTYIQSRTRAHTKGTRALLSTLFQMLWKPFLRHAPGVLTRCCTLSENFMLCFSLLPTTSNYHGAFSC